MLHGGVLSQTGKNLPVNRVNGGIFSVWISPSKPAAKRRKGYPVCDQHTTTEHRFPLIQASLLILACIVRLCSSRGQRPAPTRKPIQQFFLSHQVDDFFHLRSQFPWWKHLSTWCNNKLLDCGPRRSRLLTPQHWYLLETSHKPHLYLPPEHKIEFIRTTMGLTVLPPKRRRKQTSRNHLKYLLSEDIWVI